MVEITTSGLLARIMILKATNGRRNIPQTRWRFKSIFNFNLSFLLLLLLASIHLFGHYSCCNFINTHPTNYEEYGPESVGCNIQVYVIHRNINSRLPDLIYGRRIVIEIGSLSQPIRLLTHHPKAFADLATASSNASNACSSSFVPL